MTVSKAQKAVNPNPAVAAAAGIILYCAILFISPVELVHSVQVDALAFVISCYIMFFLGVALTTNRKIDISRPKYSNKKLRNQHGYLAVAAVISVVSVAYDRFASRGASLAGDWLDRRDALAEAASTPFGVMGALLLPAAYLYLFEVYRARATGQSKFRIALVFAILLCLAHPLIGLMFGSRSILLSSLFFIGTFSLYYRQKRINWPLIAKWGIGSAVFLLFSALLFLDRLELMNMMPTQSAQYSVYAFTVRPSNWVLEALLKDSASIAFIVIFALINTVQYYTHGLLELLYQVAHESQISHSYGAYLLFIPYKTVAMFIDLPDVFVLINNAKVSIGAYTSFFGPVHSDFGWLGIVFMFFFGIWSGHIFNMSRFALNYVPLSILLAATAFLFPVVNFLLLGPNFYIMIGFIFFALSNRWRNVAQLKSTRIGA